MLWTSNPLFALSSASEIIFTALSLAFEISSFVLLLALSRRSLVFRRASRAFWPLGFAISVVYCYLSLIICFVYCFSSLYLGFFYFCPLLSLHFYLILCFHHCAVQFFVLPQWCSLVLQALIDSRTVCANFSWFSFSWLERRYVVSRQVIYSRFVFAFA